MAAEDQHDAGGDDTPQSGMINNTVSAGMVTGVVQAGVITGGVHYHLPALTLFRDLGHTLEVAGALNRLGHPHAAATRRSRQPERRRR